MSQPVDAHSYLAAVITLYLEKPETPMRASLADPALARRLYKEGVSSIPSNLHSCSALYVA